MTKIKQLEKQFGGKWEYLGMSVWACPDDKKTVQCVSDCSCDFDCYCSPKYYLYGDGIPKEVHFKLIAVRLCKEQNCLQKGSTKKYEY